MPNVLLSAYSGEGSTDRRFLGPIIRHTLEELVLEGTGQIEVLAPFWLQVAKQKDEIIAAAHRAQSEGYQILCIHTDADRRGVEGAYTQSLLPALTILRADPSVTLRIVPLIPERTTEAWMLADFPTLCGQLEIDLSQNDLNIAGDPEGFANPKEKLRTAVRIANEGKGAHLQTSVEDLYEALGKDVDLLSLGRLPSYQRFRRDLRKALVEVGYVR